MTKEDAREAFEKREARRNGKQPTRVIHNQNLSGLAAEFRPNNSHNGNVQGHANPQPNHIVTSHQAQQQNPSAQHLQPQQQMQNNQQLQQSPPTCNVGEGGRPSTEANTGGV